MTYCLSTSMYFKNVLEYSDYRYKSTRPGVIVIEIVVITFFTVIVIVMVNLILKVIVIVIVDKVIVIHYYFAITFCQTHNTFCQICHKSHCHLIGCSIKLSFIILFITNSVTEKQLHLIQTKHYVINRIQVDYHELLILPQLRIYIWHPWLVNVGILVPLFIYKLPSLQVHTISYSCYHCISSDIHIIWFLIYFMLYLGYYQ